MKKITQAATTGGAPIYLDDFKDVFNDEIWDAMQALLSPFDSDTEGIIISGCAVSGAGPHNIAAGIVYLDGEFRRFAAQTGVTLPQYIKAATDVNTSRTFEDTTTKTLYVTKSADLASSAPGAGQYIAITSATDAEDRRVGKYQMPKIKIIPIGDWNMDADASVTVAHGLNSAKIVSYTVTILDDSSQGHPFSSEAIDTANTFYDGTNFQLTRQIAGIFDSATYNATGFNRGFISVQYTT